MMQPQPEPQTAPLLLPPRERGTQSVRHNATCLYLANLALCKARLKQKRDRLKATLMSNDRARDVMNTLAIMGEHAWLADCKASMFSAALCIGRITPIHLPAVLRDRIIHEMLLGAIGEALSWHMRRLIDDGDESWHMRRYRSKFFDESYAIWRGMNPSLELDI